jgi:hypothetical protein
VLSSTVGVHNLEARERRNLGSCSPPSFLDCNDDVVWYAPQVNVCIVVGNVMLVVMVVVVGVALVLAGVLLVGLVVVVDVALVLASVLLVGVLLLIVCVRVVLV